DNTPRIITDWGHTIMPKNRTGPPLILPDSRCTYKLTGGGVAFERQPAASGLEIPADGGSTHGQQLGQDSSTAAMYLPDGIPIIRHTLISCFLAFWEYLVGLCFRRSIRTTFSTPMVLEIRYRRAVDRPTPVEAQN